jgi:hypothetical protein
MTKSNPNAHIGCSSHADHDRNFVDFDLLSPLVIKGITCAIELPFHLCANIQPKKDWLMTGILFIWVVVLLEELDLYL